MEGKPTVGVVIPTFKRPEMVERSVASVPDWARVIVVDDGAIGGRPDAAFLSWYDGAYRIKTDLVCLLFDDDWHEPTFIERTMAMLENDVAYVFADAMIHFADGTTRRNLPDIAPTGCLDSEMLGDTLLRTDAIITPSCCLFRRQDVLDNLLPGNVPCMPHNDIISGSDALLSMLPLLKYPRVGWINEPLVNLDGGTQSTTIREMSGEDGGKALRANYDNVRKFFHIMREAKRQCVW